MVAGVVVDKPLVGDLATVRRLESLLRLEHLENALDGVSSDRLGIPSSSKLCMLVVDASIGENLK